MSDLQQLGLLALSSFQWPITYRYTYATPWGLTRQEITLDVPPLNGYLQESADFGVVWWRSSIATAISEQVALISCQAQIWFGATFPWPAFAGLVSGRYPGAAAGRNECACIMMHSGHRDDLAMRRLLLPGTPRAWVEDRMINPTGLRQLETMSAFLVMSSFGFVEDLPGPIGWAVRHTNVRRGPLHVDQGFRKVKYLRVNQYTSRAPDASVEPWP